MAVKNNRNTIDCRWDKNDTKDAAVIADLISQGKFLFYGYASMPLRDLRNLLSLKRRLKKQEHGHKVRIKNSLLAQYFPELDGYYRDWGKEGLAIVRWCLDPSVIAGLEYDEFRRLVAPNGRGGMPQQERLKSIWKKSMESIGCAVGEFLDVETKLMVEGLQYIRAALSYVEKKIEDNVYCGRTAFQAPEVDGLTYVYSNQLQLGAFYDVKIKDALEYDLIGETV